MAAIRPEPADVLRAADTYVGVAYGADVPVAVRSQLAVLRTWKGDFFRSPAIAADRETPPRRYTIRLGNRQYPHMKLAMELSPDGQTFLYRADTHDAHCLPPPTSAEYAPFLHVMEENQKVASAIEAAWADQGLATFKTYLREDLARRRQGPAGE